jgi:hypothetical protein
MVQIYCGNNAQDPQLLTGNVVLGTRYGCMRKGIGHGLYLPYDPKFAGAYMPIDQRRIYCGNQPDLPVGYDNMGSLVQCIQKGVGIGKRQRAEQGPPRFMLFIRIILPILIFLILATGLFSYLYFTKPSIVTTRDSDNREHFDWIKFSAFYIPTVALLGVIIFLFWKFWVLRRY